MTPQFAMVVGAARSGTTLVRALLDGHPEIRCPAEAGLPALIAQLAETWRVIHADELDAAPESTNGPVTVPPEARAWILETIARPIASACRSGERVYCDKSLDSAGQLPLVHELMPGTRVIFTYRHVMDTIASGLDASPYGFTSFGYAPYVQASPSNFVAALARYWLDQVSRALAWEGSHPESSLRVRYEDLVQNPRPALAAVQTFLGVKPDLTSLSSAFERDPRSGPGDYKLDDTSGVHAHSIGRGKRIPVVLIQPQLRAMINQKLAALNYPKLTSDWNAGAKVWGR